jgi:putative nucleotidyltransferase with HDIG domain
VTDSNLQSSLLAFQAMADFGHQLSSEQGFPDKAHQMLRSLAGSACARSAAIYALNPPRELRVVAALHGERTRYPQNLCLSEQQLETISSLSRPLPLSDSDRHHLLSAATGLPHNSLLIDLFAMVAPLRIGSELLGALILGAPQQGVVYGEVHAESVHLLSGTVALLLQNHQLVVKLETQVRDNLRLVTGLNELQDQALQAFALAIDAKDTSRRGHSPRVASYAMAIGRGLGMDTTAIAGLRAAGYLHDIGDMNIDKALFRKQSALHPEEFREIADHSILGYQIVRNVKFPWPEVADVVRSHHERADGSGYPDRLRNDEVSLPVRIIAAADSFDAMLSDRPYRSSIPIKMALEDLIRATPQRYDASVVQALLVQLRREAEGKAEERILPAQSETPSVRDYDAFSVELLKKITNYRVYSA